jgi:hypothetical protein
MNFWILYELLANSRSAISTPLKEDCPILRMADIHLEVKNTPVEYQLQSRRVVEPGCISVMLHVGLMIQGWKEEARDLYQLKSRAFLKKSKAYSNNYNHQSHRTS